MNKCSVAINRTNLGCPTSHFSFTFATGIRYHLHLFFLHIFSPILFCEIYFSFHLFLPFCFIFAMNNILPRPAIYNNLIGSTNQNNCMSWSVCLAVLRTFENWKSNETKFYKIKILSNPTNHRSNHNVIHVLDMIFMFETLNGCQQSKIENMCNYEHHNKYTQTNLKSWVGSIHCQMKHLFISYKRSGNWKDEKHVCINEWNIIRWIGPI